MQLTEEELQELRQIQHNVSGSDYMCFAGIADAVSTDSFSPIDDVQIAPLATQPPETIETVTTKIEVEQDAVLELDFGGMIELDEVRFNGRLVIGLINATTQPVFMKGAGALYVSPRGTVLLLQ